jgi:hypothetical protein
MSSSYERLVNPAAVSCDGSVGTSDGYTHPVPGCWPNDPSGPEAAKSANTPQSAWVDALGASPLIMAM